MAERSNVSPIESVSDGCGTAEALGTAAVAGGEPNVKSGPGAAVAENDATTGVVTSAAAGADGALAAPLPNTNGFDASASLADVAGADDGALPKLKRDGGADVSLSTLGTSAAGGFGAVVAETPAAVGADAPNANTLGAVAAADAALAWVGGVDAAAPNANTFEAPTTGAAGVAVAVTGADPATLGFAAGSSFGASFGAPN